MNNVLQETVYLDHAGAAAGFGAVPVGVVPGPGGTGAHPWTTTRVYTGHQNEPRRLTDQNLNLYGSWDSDPFGTGAWNYNPAGFGSVFFDLRLPGQSSGDAGATHDTTTNFNTTRSYQPSVGRYLQSDKIGLAGADQNNVNTYAYVGSNPVNNVDPKGTDFFGVPGPGQSGPITIPAVPQNLPPITRDPMCVAQCIFSEILKDSPQEGGIHYGIGKLKPFLSHGSGAALMCEVGEVGIPLYTVISTEVSCMNDTACMRPLYPYTGPQSYPIQSPK
jgi:RHS repeat-associated protein